MGDRRPLCLNPPRITALDCCRVAAASLLRCYCVATASLVGRHA